MKKYVPRRDLARALGILPGTIGAWDRHGKGVGKPIYVSSRFVVYLETDVREFFRARGEYDEVWVAPQERQKRAAERRERAARTRPSPAARSGSTKAPATSTPDECGREAPNVTAEPDGEP